VFSVVRILRASVQIHHGCLPGVGVPEVTITYCVNQLSLSSPHPCSCFAEGRGPLGQEFIIIQEAIFRLAAQPPPCQGCHGSP